MPSEYIWTVHRVDYERMRHEREGKENAKRKGENIKIYKKIYKVYAHCNVNTLYVWSTVLYGRSRGQAMTRLGCGYLTLAYEEMHLAKSKLHLPSNQHSLSGFLLVLFLSLPLLLLLFSRSHLPLQPHRHWNKITVWKKN